MNDEKPTTADLLEAWRETTRAADLAERLATIALEAADHADRSARGTEGEVRTRTGLPPAVFKTAASAGSATSAPGES